MSAASSTALRPASQPRDHLVLHVENVPLAGRLLTIAIFEMQNVAPTKAMGTPSSAVRSAPSTSSISLSSARASGFRVAARDDVENEYSLFVTRQKAEYLYRAAYPAESAAIEPTTTEAMANGILAHLSIIGNRQRDVGRLVCREPEPHVEKKIRVLPVSTPPNMQKNPHLPSKRQDQRAVRVLKTSKRTMEAVAQAMRRPDSELNGDEESVGSAMESGKFDRKSSQASILHRMAVADSKTMWKAELETNYEESERPSLYESDTPTATQEYTLSPGLSPVRRALPERKPKHKDLEERRQKGRHQRILIAQAAQEAPNSAMLVLIQAQDSYSAVMEEVEQDSDLLSPDSGRQTSTVTTVSINEKPIPQPTASSTPRSSVVVGNAYGLKNLPDYAKAEPEQFLRRRASNVHRIVLRKDRWQDDIPGMGIEITDQRPTLQTPPNKLDALLNTARRVMLLNTAGSSMKRNTSTSRLVSERRSNRVLASPSPYHAALSASHSAPLLQSPKVEKPRDDSAKPESSVQGPIAAPQPLEENPAGIHLKDAVESITKGSPRSQTKLTDAAIDDQPRKEPVNLMTSALIPESFQKQPDDQGILQDTTEDILPSNLSILNERDEELESMLRPRSDSLGYERVEHFEPLPSVAPKPSVLEFLAPPDPEQTPRSSAECEVLQDIPPLDPEVVLYHPNELIFEEKEDIEAHTSESVDELLRADKLSFQGFNGDIDAFENALKSPVNVNMVIDKKNPEQLPTPIERRTFPQTCQQDVFPPTARQGCWEESSLPVISSDASEEAVGGFSSDVAAVKMGNPTKPDEEEIIQGGQQIPARKHGFEAIWDNTTLQSSTLEEKGIVAEQNSSELVEMIKNAKSDNQVQSYGNSPRIGEEDRHNFKDAISNPLPGNGVEYLDRDDRDQCGNEYRSASSSLILGCIASDTISNAEITGHANDTAEDGLNASDDGADEAVKVDSSSASVAPHDTKAMEHPTDYIREGSGNAMMHLTLVADSLSKIPFVDDQNYFGNNLASSRTTDSSIQDGNLIQHDDNTLPSKDQVNVHPEAEEDTTVCEDNHRDGVHEKMLDAKSEKVDSYPAIVTQQYDNKVNQMERRNVTTSISGGTSSEIATNSGKEDQPAVDAAPARERPIGISRKKSLSPSKKSSPTSSSQVKTSSKGLGGSKRKSIAAQVVDKQVVTQQTLKLERRHTVADVKKNGFPQGMRRMSTIDPSDPLPGLPSSNNAKTVAKVPMEKSFVSALRFNSKHQTPSKHYSPQHSGVVQSMTNYHKKWGKWMAGKNIIEKIGCLQQEELLMADPKNEENLLKLGLRYARSSGTSMPAILLLEHAALLHENATGTPEYWFWLGSAHLDIFMRHRKYLPAARFHLSKSLRAFTSAFAYMESLADPMLLLRYAIGLFWHKGDGNLEKTRDIFHELFSRFVGFCDKDRPNLLFLQFQVLHRLKLYVDAIDCMVKILALSKSPPRKASSTGVLVLPSANATPHFAFYDAADYRLMLMQCQQASGDYLSAAQTLASVLTLKNVQQDTTLQDEEYFDLWCSLAEKCFHHEDYTLALEYYAIALNFAKQSQVLAAIHYNLGLCFQSLGEDNKCMTEYKRARTANRQVPPLVSLTELSSTYDERFAQLLQQSVVQTIEVVRVELYGKAVRRLQRVFRQSRRNLNINLDSTNLEVPLTKMPSLSKRRLSIAEARNPPTFVKIENARDETEAKEDESLPQQAVALDDNQASRYEDSTLEIDVRRLKSFLARKQAVIEEIAELLTNPQYRAREILPSSRPSVRLKGAIQLRSGFLSPEIDRLDARRKQSMETFRQLGYVSSTMPWIEFWEKLLALALKLFESRQALYGSVARIRGRLPLVSDEVAFCALAESIGNVHEAAEKLQDASYERELTYVCAVIDVSKLLERGFPLEPTQLSLKSPHVSLPTISLPSADSIAAYNSLSPIGAVASRRLVLPPYSPTRSTSASTSKPRKHRRMNQMLDLQFQEHVQKQAAAIAINDATGGFVHAHQRTEKLVVLQDFRQANNLLRSQLAFGSEKAVT